MNTSQFREECARKVDSMAGKAPDFSAFVGLDGFVDEITHAVDQREDAHHYSRIPTISKLAERIAAAANKSTNIEMVNQLTKLGGNGPIMANALANLGLKVTYVGALGYPHIPPVFQPFSERASIHTIAESGHTDALEFLDGKLMLVKSISLNDVTWANLQERFGRDRFLQHFSTADLIAFVNWTMITGMSEIWEALLKDFCPLLKGPRRKIFFDLADPEKRSADDLAHALKLISDFEPYFDVILGLNEKESSEVADVLGIDHSDHSPEGLIRTAREIQCKLLINTLVVHPVTYALAVSEGKADLVYGPVITQPKLTTGAGDHFNSGFCLGKLFGLKNDECLLLGVATSGYYVMNGQTPAIPDLIGLMRNWPSGSGSES